MSAPARLVRDGNGGYATPDGRWTVVPVTMGEGQVNGRWSVGHREWRLTDTTGAAHFGYRGRSHAVVPALWRARDIIEAHR